MVFGGGRNPKLSGVTWICLYTLTALHPQSQWTFLKICGDVGGEQKEREWKKNQEGKAMKKTRKKLHKTAQIALLHRVTPIWERDILSTSSKNMMWLRHPEESRKCDAQLPTKGSPTWAAMIHSGRGRSHREQLSHGLLSQWSARDSRPKQKEARAAAWDNRGHMWYPSETLRDS